ncbi:MAG: phosphatase PAP2 family protein [Atopobiaceae bacterium]|nr:phosphatase PAP2 family protein [Atopobiaceae bacterium]
MDFLFFLEGLRVPGLNEFMSALTWLGHPYLFLLVCISLMWCVSKRQAFYIMVVGITGTVINQWLKLIFRIPRPWLLDSQLSIVESARSEALGYSFPSGHTQFAVSITAGLIASSKKLWIRILCAVLLVAVPFSRMYLGVHTPLDVGVAAGLALALTIVIWPFFKDDESFEKNALWVLCVMAVLALAFVVWVHVMPFPADIDAHNLEEGVKNAWLLLGCSLGLIVSHVVDSRWLHFDVSGTAQTQALKLVFGLAITIGLVLGLKPALIAIFGDVMWISVIRYFVPVVFAGCIWPLTFPWFARLGTRNEVVERMD